MFCKWLIEIEKECNFNTIEAEEIQYMTAIIHEKLQVELNNLQKNKQDTI